MLLTAPRQFDEIIQITAHFSIDGKNCIMSSVLTAKLMQVTFSAPTHTRPTPVKSIRLVKFAHLTGALILNAFMKRKIYQILVDRLTVCVHA
jgi:hypothetical protein